MANSILRDIRAEAERLMDAADEHELPLRLIGGLAIRLHAANGMHPVLERSYLDIDVVTTRKASKRVAEFFAEMGYRPNERFNAINAGVRMVFYDDAQGRHVDVFVEHFEMCHKISLTGRLEVQARTVPLAELLLTKLQIVELNPKDVTDILAVLIEHDVGPGDDETVNSDYLAGLLASDWGLWRTVQGTISTIRTQLPASGLGPDDQACIDDRLERLWTAVDAAPKKLRWKARARVGERTKWYQLPEEIDHAKSGA